MATSKTSARSFLPPLLFVDLVLPVNRMSPYPGGEAILPTGRILTTYSLRRHRIDRLAIVLSMNEANGMHMEQQPESAAGLL
jgi:hypothetical protein